MRTPRNGSGSGTGSVGQWRHQYECGGLAAVLHVGHAPGRASSLPAEVIAGMRAKLAEPTGCASFHELWRFGRTDLSSAHDLLRDLVHRHPRLGRTPRGSTPHAHQKKADAEACFRATLAHRLRQAALTPTPVKWESELLPLEQLQQLPKPLQPLRVWTQDEGPLWVDYHPASPLDLARHQAHSTFAT